MKQIDSEETKSKSNKKTKTIKKLRHNEYYSDMQKLQDTLYSRSKEKENFYNLMQYITSEGNIMLAVRNIKANKGRNTKGINSTLMQDILNENREVLIDYVRSRFKDFKPHRVKRVYIPKPNGEKRPLGLPTMEDRLLQQCILQVLEPIAEAKFYKHSYGFRPHRSTKHAFARVNHILNTTNCYYAVDVDIKGFFDNVSHSKLIKQLYTMGIKDKKLLSIIKAILKAEIKDNGKIIKPTKGTPQGGIISPLLANIVLNELDWWISTQYGEYFKTNNTFTGSRALGNKTRALKQTKLKPMYLVRYADDFVIFTTNRTNANKIQIAVNQWLNERLKLEVNKNKTNIINLKKKRLEYLSYSFKVRRNKNLNNHKRINNNAHKYVTHTQPDKKSIMKMKQELRIRIKDIKYTFKHKDRINSINNYNAYVRGIINYFQYTSNCFNVFSNISWNIRIITYNRLRRAFKLNFETRNPNISTVKRYRTKRVFKIGELELMPLTEIKNVECRQFNPEVCKYTEKGRSLIHKTLGCIDKRILNKIERTPIYNMSMEFNDNRLSKYTAQLGKCYITKSPLKIGEMDLHHKIPIFKGGTDNFNNLVYLNKDVHRLVHTSKEDRIQELLAKIYEFNQELNMNKFKGKINFLRLLIGLEEI